MKGIREARWRSVAKALTWRVIATTTTMALTYAATHDWQITTVVGVADVTLKLIFYYLHERAWGRLQVGRNVEFK